MEMVHNICDRLQEKRAHARVSISRKIDRFLKKHCFKLEKGNGRSL